MTLKNAIVKIINLDLIYFRILSNGINKGYYLDIKLQEEVKVGVKYFLANGVKQWNVLINGNSLVGG